MKQSIYSKADSHSFAQEISLHTHAYRNRRTLYLTTFLSDTRSELDQTY